MHLDSSRCLRLLLKALCMAETDSSDIVDDTCGIIFLGTPHQGSPMSVVGAIVAFLTRLLGSSTGILLSLRNHHVQLSDLEDRFGACMKKKESRRRKTDIVSFYEAKHTFFLGFVPCMVRAAVLYITSHLTSHQVVTRESARGGHAADPILIDTDHSGLNKCSGHNDELYTELKKTIGRLAPYVTNIAFQGSPQLTQDNIEPPSQR